MPQEEDLRVLLPGEISGMMSLWLHGYFFIVGKQPLEHPQRLSPRGFGKEPKRHLQNKVPWILADPISCPPKGLIPKSHHSYPSPLLTLQMRETEVQSRGGS